jgi:hypothetical protein
VGEGACPLEPRPKHVPTPDRSGVFNQRRNFLLRLDPGPRMHI